MADRPAIPLPTSLLLGSVLGTSAVVGGAWAASAWALGRGDADAVPGLLAAGIVGLCTAGGLLSILPWRARPVSTWITLWLAQTVVRLLLTPVLTFLLYSATSFNATPLFVAVGVTYLAAVVSEAGVLARYLRRCGSA
ncbi:MAG: hypothetical protein ACYS0G_10835 [Planctomycetota bacterium]